MHRLTVLVAAVLLSLFALPASAQESKPVVVKRADWIAAMKTQLPAAFCADHMYFRKCFDITAETCRETAQKATLTCLEESKDDLPANLKQPEDGTKWGTVVGSCAGVAFEKALLSKRKKDPRCDDAKNWVP